MTRSTSAGNGTDPFLARYREILLFFCPFAALLLLLVDIGHVALRLPSETAVAGRPLAVFLCALYAVRDMYEAHAAAGSPARPVPLLTAFFVTVYASALYGLAVVLAPLSDVPYALIGVSKSLNLTVLLNLLAGSVAGIWAKRRAPVWVARQRENEHERGPRHM